MVAIVGGHLTISLAGDTQTLMPITAESVPLATELNDFSFQILGRPDTHIRFFMSGENIRGLYYEEKRENDLVLAIAAPKFSGPSS